MKLASLAPVLLLATVASAEVHVVAADGSGEYLEIADAVAAAVDGDLVYVRGGVYDQNVLIDDRSIDVVGIDGVSVNLTASLDIRNVSASRSVTVFGLTLLEGFAVVNCDGPVQIQGCAVPASLADMPGTIMFSEYSTCGIGESRQRIVSSSRVAVTSCDFRGRHGQTQVWDGAPGEHALRVFNSTVVITDTYLEGGDGGAPFEPPPFLVFAGAGGDGLHVDNNSSVLIEGLTAFGGNGYDSTFFQVVRGCDGDPIRTDATSTVTESTSPELRIFTRSTIRGGQPELLQVFGEPGATLVLVSSPNAGWRPFGSFMGTLLVGPPLQIDILGTIPSGGLFHHQLMPPDPGTDDDHLELQIQVLSLHNGGRWLSKPWRISVVDSTL